MFPFPTATLSLFKGHTPRWWQCPGPAKFRGEEMILMGRLSQTSAEKAWDFWGEVFLGDKDLGEGGFGLLDHQ